MKETCLHCKTENEVQDSGRFRCSECGWINDITFDEFRSLSSDIPALVLPEDLGPYLRTCEDPHVAWIPYGKRTVEKLSGDEQAEMLEVWQIKHPSAAEKERKKYFHAILTGKTPLSHTLTLKGIRFQKSRGYVLPLPAQLWKYVEGFAESSFYTLRIFDGPTLIETFPRAQPREYDDRHPMFLLSPSNPIDKDRDYRIKVSWQ